MIRVNLISRQSCKLFNVIVCTHFFILLFCRYHITQPCSDFGRSPTGINFENGTKIESEPKFFIWNFHANCQRKANEREKNQTLRMEQCEWLHLLRWTKGRNGLFALWKWLYYNFFNKFYYSFFLQKAVNADDARTHCAPRSHCETFEP